MDEHKLMEHIESEQIANCSFKNGEHKSIDTYSIKVVKKFEQNIKQRYEEFIAKSLMLGLDMQFGYTVENREVKITRYTGASKRVILPNFITTVNKRAFVGGFIEELKLNEGLKYIGNSAFEFNAINQVVIPKTVEFVGYQAFRGNTKLISSGGEYTNAVNVLSNKTILLH